VAVEPQPNGSFPRHLLPRPAQQTQANAWLSNNLAPHYVRATGIGFQIAIANCAAFVATFTLPVEERVCTTPLFSRLESDIDHYQSEIFTGHSINIGALILYHGQQREWNGMEWMEMEWI